MIAKITTRCPLSSGSLAELVFHATAERKIRYYLESLDTITKNLEFVVSLGLRPFGPAEPLIEETKILIFGVRRSYALDFSLLYKKKDRTAHTLSFFKLLIGNNYCSSLGLASFTIRLRPMKSFSCRADTALSASSSLTNVTKPNPLERPENLSLMMIASSTSPNSAKSPLRSSSDAFHEMFPTNSFFAILCGD